MNSSSQNIALELTRDEALVLFEWLARLDERPLSPQTDQVEQGVLWGLEAKLEASLVEVVHPDYRSLLQAAKERLTGVE